MTADEWAARTCCCPHPDPHECAAERGGRRVPDEDERCECECHGRDEDQEDDDEDF